MGSEPFSKLVHDSKARTKFILSAIRLIKTYGFDGLGNLLIKLRLQT
jgi:GH18 family chitinase